MKCFLYRPIDGNSGCQVMTAIIMPFKEESGWPIWRPNPGLWKLLVSALDWKMMIGRGCKFDWYTHSFYKKSHAVLEKVHNIFFIITFVFIQPKTVRSNLCLVQLPKSGNNNSSIIIVWSNWWVCFWVAYVNRFQKKNDSKKMMKIMRP